MDVCYGNSIMKDVFCEPYAISFSFYSTKEIHDLSVVEVVCPIFFDRKGFNLPGGLCDQKMGVNSRKDICVTCHGNYLSCPGHIGHIDLAVPIKNPLLKNIFLKILISKCNYCNFFPIQNWRLKLFFFKFLYLNINFYFFKEKKKFYEKKKKKKIFTEFSKVKNLSKKIKSMAKIEFSPKILKIGRRKRGKLWYFAVNFFMKYCSKIKSCKRCGGGRNVIFCSKENINVFKKKHFYLKRKFRKFENKRQFIEHYQPQFFVDRNKKLFDKENYNKNLCSFQLKKNVENLWLCENDFCQLIWGTLGNSERFHKEQQVEIFFISSLLVPPTRFRPVYLKKLGERIFETKINPQNFYLMRALKINQQILLFMGNYSEEEKQQYWKRLIFQLEKTILSMIDKYIYPNEEKRDYPSGIKQKLEKKNGIFRMYLMGKRVFHSARSVIVPDPFLECFEVGIPSHFVDNLNSFSTINFLNFHNFIHLISTKKKNRTDILETLYGNKSFLETNEKISGVSMILNLCRKYKKHFFEKGKIFFGINRYQIQLNSKNFVLLNRQPSLHRASVMSHQTKITPENKCIKFHYTNCNSYNADFDGDEMNLHFPQNEIARSESLVLSSAFHHSKIPTHKTIMRGLIQDNVVSLMFLTKKDTFFNEHFPEQLSGFLMRENNFEFKQNFPTIIKPQVLWTGKQIISELMKVFFDESWRISLESRSKISRIFFGNDETKILFRKGEFLRGTLDSSQIGKNKHGLIHAFNEKYGNYIADKFLNFLGKISIFFQRYRGFSTGIHDLVLKKKIDKNRCKTFRKENCLLKIYLRKSMAKNGIFFRAFLGEKFFFMHTFRILNFLFSHKVILENFIQNLRNTLGFISSKIIEPLTLGGLETPLQLNSFAQMTNSGAKGTCLNIYQICSNLGQTELEGEFVNLGPGGKSLPAFCPYDLSPRANGFIFQRFLTGILQPQYFFHCMAGREGLLDTSVKTSQSGYIQRSLMKHLESLKIYYDQTIRFSDNSLLCFFYPKNGTNPSSFDYKYFLPWLFQNFKKKKLTPANNFFNFGLKVNDIKKTSKDVKLENLKKKNFFFFLNKKDLSSGENVISNFQLKRKIILFSKKIFFEEKKVLDLYKTDYFYPGEPIGIISSQSIGEPCTQMTLNTFHFAGKLISKNNFGIPRLREILLIATKYPKNPTMSIQFKDHIPPKMFFLIEKRVRKIFLFDLLKSINSFTQFQGKATIFFLRLKIVQKNFYKHQMAIQKNTVIEEIKKYFKKSKKHPISLKNRFNSNEKKEILFKNKKNAFYLKWPKRSKNEKIHNTKVDGDTKKEMVEIKIKRDRKSELNYFQEEINKFNNPLREIPMIKTGFIDFKEKTVHIDGVNFYFFWKNGDIIDLNKIFSNDIYSVLVTYGIEAARKTLVHELTTIFNVQGISINNQHFDIISDYMTRLGYFRPFSRKGIFEESLLQKITYETAMEFIINSSLTKQVDNLKSTSGSICLAKICPIGTGSFHLISQK
jgi:DNA-directed RNA polymerase I subunit RPA1